jgi:hypothetical protein
MNEIQELLKQKETELAQLQKEVEALRMVAGMFPQTPLPTVNATPPAARPTVPETKSYTPGSLLRPDTAAAVASTFAPDRGLSAYAPAPAANGGTKRFP